MKGLPILLSALVLAAPATAANRDPQITSLRKQVTALQAQMRALQAQVDRNQQTTLCYYALTQDSFRVVFGALNQFALFLTGHTAPAWDTYLAQPKFDDQGACAAVGLTRP